MIFAPILDWGLHHGHDARTSVASPTASSKLLVLIFISIFRLLLSLLVTLRTQLLRSGKFVVVTTLGVPHVALELLAQLDHPFEMFGSELEFGLVAQRVLFILCHGNGGLEGVSDLSAIPLGALHLLVLQDVTLGSCSQADIRTNPLETVDEVLPDVLGGIFRQLRIVKRDVDARLECLVEISNTVGGEEQNSFVIFKNTKKH
jgi:hypothetical protein